VPATLMATSAAMAVAMVMAALVWPRRTCGHTCRWPCRGQWPNRLPISRPTPQTTLWIMPPTPEADDEADDVVADLPAAVPSPPAPAPADLICLGIAVVESCVAEESLLDGASWDRPSHRPTVLNAVWTGPASCEAEACRFTDPPEVLELAPLFDWCLVGEGATASPGDPPEPPPSPPPGPPAAGHPGRSDVISATRRTVTPDAAAVAAGVAPGCVGWVEIGACQAPARHTIATPPDTIAVGLAQDLIGVDTMREQLQKLEETDRGRGR
jgi:hypothetical protein